MQIRPIVLLGSLLAIGGCTGNFPVPNDFDRIVASYQTEIQATRVSAMKTAGLSSAGPDKPHEAPPSAMAGTHRMIAEYRAANRAQGKQALARELDTLRVLEGMAFIQTNRLDDAARMGKQVRQAGLALGARDINKVALMGLSFSALVSGWRDADWFASTGSPRTAPRVTIAASRQAVRRLLAAASCIDALLDTVRGAPRTVKLSPSMVLWVEGAPAASGRGRDVLLGNTACEDADIVAYLGKTRPVAAGTLEGNDLLYLAGSSAIYRSWVAVVVAEGYCDRLSLADAYNCRGLYVKPHLEAAADSMAAFLSPDERATDYCSAATAPAAHSRRERFVMWYAWLRFNIRNFDRRATC